MPIWSTLDDCSYHLETSVFQWETSYDAKKGLQIYLSNLSDFSPRRRFPIKEMHRKLTENGWEWVTEPAALTRVQPVHERVESPEEVTKVDSAPVSSGNDPPLGKSSEVEKATSVPRLSADGPTPESETNLDYNPFSNWDLISSGFQKEKEIWVDVKCPEIITDKLFFSVTSFWENYTVKPTRYTPFIHPGIYRFHLDISCDWIYAKFWRRDTSIDLVYLQDDIAEQFFAVGKLHYDEKEHQWEWWKPSLGQAPPIAGRVRGNPEVLEET